MLTNKGLVEHAKKALSEGWGYVWGSFSQVLSEAVLLQLKKQYPVGVGNYETIIRSKWMGRRVVDCGGLIKSYYWTQDGKFKYDGKTDITADSMLSIGREKGTIDTLPELPGVLVHKKGHVGIYIGNGLVIEAMGTKYGVVQTELKKGSWTNWSKFPYIEYVKEPSKPTTSKPTVPQYPGYLLKYNTGKVDKNVKIVQSKLGLKDDGLFGPKTLTAVKAFQVKNNLEPDGVVGKQTWNKLFN